MSKVTDPWTGPLVLWAESGRAFVQASEAARSLVEEGLDLESLVRWLTELLAGESPSSGQVSVMLLADAEIARLNREFRGKSSATDVLSFPDGESELEPRIGDVAVSLETALRQAHAAGHSLAAEVRTLLLHGVLHCLGYNHERDAGEMEKLELRLRARWLGAGEAR